jgi:hypothetical protein
LSAGPNGKGTASSCAVLAPLLISRPQAQLRRTMIRLRGFAPYRRVSWALSSFGTTEIVPFPSGDHDGQSGLSSSAYLYRIIEKSGLQDADFSPGLKSAPSKTEDKKQ